MGDGLFAYDCNMTITNRTANGLRLVSENAYQSSGFIQGTVSYGTPPPARLDPGQTVRVSIHASDNFNVTGRFVYEFEDRPENERHLTLGMATSLQDFLHPRDQVQAGGKVDEDLSNVFRVNTTPHSSYSQHDADFEIAHC